jgi:predicted transcriptional regulator
MATTKQKKQAAVAGSSDTGRVIGQSLRSLRQLGGITQHEIAGRLRVGQVSISKIEHRGDIHVQSLQRYVEALGGKLRIEAVFPSADTIAARPTRSAAPTADKQFVFPIFGEDLFQQQRDFVLSIRPHYTSKIMEGKKTVELRRRFPLTAHPGTIAYIYSTSPVRAMVGSAEITDVIKLPIAQIWKKYGKSASIERSDFDTYFDGLHEGFALRFINARPFPRPLELSELRERFGFAPPQSFLYATPVLRKAILDEFPGVPH